MAKSKELKVETPVVEAKKNTETKKTETKKAEAKQKIGRASCRERV